MALLMLILGIPQGHHYLGCGIKPIAPIGCTSDDAVCICDNNGNCEWMFVCR